MTDQPEPARSNPAFYAAMERVQKIGDEIQARLQFPKTQAERDERKALLREAVQLCDDIKVMLVASPVTLAQFNAMLADNAVWRDELKRED